MGSVAYQPPSENGGFAKLSGNKYMAPITAIMPTSPAGDDELGTVGIPDSVVELLEQEGFLLERARVAPMHEEQLGQYSGVPARVESVDGLDYGAIVPDYAATPTDDVSVYGSDGAYFIEEAEEEPRNVCITFADDDTPPSLDALEYQKLGEDTGIAAYWDRRDEVYILQ